MEKNSIYSHYPRLLSHYYPTWWLIPLSKWVITPVMSGFTLLIPLITGVINHLLSGMSHQVLYPIQNHDFFLTLHVKHRPNSLMSREVPLQRSSEEASRKTLKKDADSVIVMRRRSAEEIKHIYICICMCIYICIYMCIYIYI